jgi:carbamoyl-phosphate synthase large subunit
MSKKILILGSGALKIGEAGEFDYSGSQAIKALKEEGITTVLVNPNIATIQTSEGFADRVYFLPVTPEFVERVIAKERPDGILLSFGGQTALNCGVALHNAGIFDRYDVRVLGTPVGTIEDTEDRKRFVDRLAEIDVATPKSFAVSSLEEAKKAALKIGYPIMIRIAYALGGLGSGLCINEEELEKRAGAAFSYTNQILVEEFLKGWKEVEYEVVRDACDNCITVCNMENFDPLGIHTGESIVVAPSQTLTNEEYHHLREIAIKTVRHLGIVGECNIQYALHPTRGEYRVIEVNARLSRSSALASKATGYPLAFVAAKIAIGKSLLEIDNIVTGATKACFEPALDYLVVKIPRWDLKKFRRVSKRIDSGMKSVGEVMAIGRSFEEAIQKGLRMLEIGAEGLTSGTDIHFENLEEELRSPSDERIFAVYEAIKKGISIERIHELSHIDQWFLAKIQNIVKMEREIATPHPHPEQGRGPLGALRPLPRGEREMGEGDLWVGEASASHLGRPAVPAVLSRTGETPVLPEGRRNSLLPHNISSLSKDLLRRAKRMGFSDRQIARATNLDEKTIRDERRRLGLNPAIKQIDTLAAEYPARTNYLYCTYNGTEDDVGPEHKNKVMVLGSGAYRIGSSVEFDWCCVNTVQSLKRLGFSTIMVNCNPETVSTDFDECDRLYFEELTFETVLEIYEREKPFGVILAVGGQIPNNLALRLAEAGVRILGTKATSIDRAEDRHKFSQLLDELSIAQPPWKELSTIEEAKRFAAHAGYPVLVRPSYVLSGAAMAVAMNDDDLVRFLSKAAQVSPEHPVVISKFIMGAKELEIDGVARRGDVIAYVISEHVENAGVHSGDATMVVPPQRTYLETVRQIKGITMRIAHALAINGPFNIQYLAKDNDVSVIECNLRASRSFPFVSKVCGTNLIDVATKVMVDWPVPEIKLKPFNLEYVGVKAPQFSFTRLKGADPTLSVEMASTGEVGCLGDDFEEAFLKAMIAVGFKLPIKSILISAGSTESKVDFLSCAKILTQKGIRILATEGTSKFFREHGVQAETVLWPTSGGDDTADARIKAGDVDLVINIPKNYQAEELTNGYIIRRAAADFGVPLITNIQLAKRFVEALAKKQSTDLATKAWQEYT